MIDAWSIIIAQALTHYPIITTPFLRGYRHLCSATYMLAHNSGANFLMKSHLNLIFNSESAQTLAMDILFSCVIKRELKLWTKILTIDSTQQMFKPKFTRINRAVVRFSNLGELIAIDRAGTYLQLLLRQCCSAER